MSEKKVVKKKIKIKRRKKEIYFRGQKYSYISSLDLSTQLKITKEDTERLIKDVREGTTTSSNISNDS